MSAQLPNMVTHGELSVEQIAHIQKNILVFIRKDTFWDKFCSHTVVPAGSSSIEWRKLNVPELTPSQISNLTEGVTPAGLQLEYVKFVATPVDYGSWIGYTDKSKRYNYDDVVRDAKTVLAQRARDEAEIRKAMQFISGTCTMSITSGDKKFLGDLLKARTILKKNHIKPLSGNKYGCILGPEHAAKVLLDYAAEITHTSQKEAVIDGYIGELGGFILFECADEVMYKRNAAADAVAAVAGSPLAANAAGTEGVVYYTRASSAAGAGYHNDGTYAYTKASSIPGTHEANVYYPLTTEGSDAVVASTESYVLFIGKTEYGMPVQTVAFGDSSVQVIDKGLGSVPSKDGSGNILPDALNQRGSVGYKVMGFATRILADEAIIRGLFVVDDDSAEGGDSLSVSDSSRSGYSAKSVSPGN